MKRPALRAGCLPFEGNDPILVCNERFFNLSEKRNQKSVRNTVPPTDRNPVIVEFESIFDSRPREKLSELGLDSLDLNENDALTDLSPITSLTGLDTLLLQFFATATTKRRSVISKYNLTMLRL